MPIIHAHDSPHDPRQLATGYAPAHARHRRPLRGRERDHLGHEWPRTLLPDGAARGLRQARPAHQAQGEARRRRRRRGLARHDLGGRVLLDGGQLLLRDRCQDARAWAARHAAAYASVCDAAGLGAASRAPVPAYRRRLCVRVGRDRHQPVDARDPEGGHRGGAGAGEPQHAARARGRGRGGRAV